MYFKTFSCILAALVAPAFSAEGWLTNIEEAQKQAAKEDKAVLVEFTGSDWCGPCIGLKQNVFTSEDFKAIADKQLVLVELDFPRKEIDPAQKEYNAGKQKLYGITGFPSVYMQDKNGNIFWARVGGGNAAEYLEALKKGLADKDTVLADVNEAMKAEGMEKAKKLDAALKKMTGDLKEVNTKILSEQIISLDTEDTLGYAKQKKAAELEGGQMKSVQKFFIDEIRPLLKDKKYDDALTKINGYKTDDLTEKPKMMIFSLKVQTYIQQGDVDKAVEALEEGAKISPDSEEANNMKAYAKHLKDNREKILEQLKAQEKM